MNIEALARCRVEEIMDSPALAVDEHRHALSSLRRINWLSRTSQQLLDPVLKLSRDLNRRELHLVDVACGGGDVPVALARRAREHGVLLRLTLVDKSSSALEHARAHGTGVEVIAADALSRSIPRADIVTNSLFLHHLARRDAVRTLAHLGGLADHLLLVSDLRRCRMGLVVAWTTCRLASRSRVVHHDGPASVRAAWTPCELAQMAEDAGLAGHCIERCWPWRMLLEWRRPR